jgi:sec-independent protein translocase protein TatB
MFGFDWSELMIIVVVALVVLGPKDLPRALYQLGKWTRHARRITSDFQRHVDDIVRQAELEEVRKTVQDAGKQLDIRGQMAEHVNSVLDPVKDIRKALEPPVELTTPLAQTDKAAPGPGSTNGQAASEPQPVEGPKPAAEPEAQADALAHPISTPVAPTPAAAEPAVPPAAAPASPAPSLPDRTS